MADKIIDPAPVIKRLANRCLAVKGMECTILGELIDMLRAEPAVDAVEVCYCDNCVNHGNCLPEDIFRMARIEKPYCCAGKVDGDRNA